MFGPSDTISVDIRLRIFNTRIRPLWKDIRGRAEKGQLAFAFLFKFSDESFKEIEPVTDKDHLRKVYESFDLVGSWDKHCRAKGMFSEWSPPGMVAIVCFFVAPRGTLHDSVWRLSTNTETLLPQTTETAYTYNPWYSNEVLWDMAKGYDDLFARIAKADRIPGHYIVLVLNMTAKTKFCVYYSYADYEEECALSLVPPELVKYVRKAQNPSEASGDHIVVFNVMNYTADYYLLLRMEKKDDTFVMSPIPFELDEGGIIAGESYILPDLS